MKNISLLYIYLILLIPIIDSCGQENDHSTGEIKIILTDSISLENKMPVRVYWEPSDSNLSLTEQKEIALENIYSNYEGENIDTSFLILTSEGYKSLRPINGWEISIHKSEDLRNVLRLNNDLFTFVEIRARDIVLKGDSLRIAILHVKEPVNFKQREISEPVDYLFLTPYGNDSMSIVLDQGNIGAIDRHTYFRVGRQVYALKSLSMNRKELIIEPQPRGRYDKFTAELDIRYKQVPVRSLAGEKTTISHSPGKKLAICFWDMSNEGKDIIRLDSIYTTLSKADQKSIEIALVNRVSQIKDIKKFVEKWDIRLPVYSSLPNTCTKLNCRPQLPYYLEVESNGRTSSYYERLPKLEELLLQKLE